jgi:hypothetical protein
MFSTALTMIRYPGGGFEGTITRIVKYTLDDGIFPMVVGYIFCCGQVGFAGGTGKKKMLPLFVLYWPLLCPQEEE